jgi:thiamine pyrophosphate-dependent acetolactate synthase large subunit-like protein
MNTTDVLVQCLENEGVEFVFGIVGSHWILQIHYQNQSKFFS